MTKAKHNGRRKVSAPGKTRAGRSAHVMNPECLALIENFRLMDDTFMSKCLENAPECIELILQIILGKKDLKVVKSQTEYPIKSLQGRGVRFDVFARDSEGKEYDFNGNSLKDLKNGIIDTCGDPDIIFDEDPLRILRAVRFSSKLRYPISERTKAGIRRHKGRLDIISQERITDEINKILSGPHPEVGMELLHTLELCEIVLPEMTEIMAYDLYEVVKAMHNIKVRAVENNLDQLTLMLSYISYKVNPLIFRASMRRMRYSSEMIDKVFLYAFLLDKAIFVSEFHSTVNLRELGYLAKTKENYDMLLALVEAIKQRIWDKMKQEPPYNMFGYTLPVNGNDIMDTLGIGPGQKIKAVQEDLLCDAFVNPNLSKEECINLIKIRFGNK